MKRLLAVLALIVAPAPSFSQPGNEVTKTCMKAGSTSPLVTYVSIPANDITGIEDRHFGRTETTIRFDQDEMGAWETSSTNAFGLIYNGNRIAPDQIARISREKPSSFDLSLAR